MDSRPIRSDVSRLLDAWSQGDPKALDRLIPLVYDELRQIARRHLALEAPGHSLQPTAVVHEACLYLLERRKVDWKSRAQFFGHVAEVIRHILVDHARKRRAARRGGGAPRISLDETLGLATKAMPDLVAVDEAVKDLEALDRRQGQIVILRFYAGLTEEEIGHLLNVSAKTVQREWKTARLWLHRELGPG